ncbi:MAG: leucine-rich repeat domain-containing protein [Candidatus Poribacteria bacterium]|nr:leucine-rich repeat domain-containing protein [Candidatus Poribacteria bacterium]
MKEKLCKSLGFQFLFFCVMGIFVYNTFAYGENEEEWMPDPALREAVREKFRIPADSPLTQAYMQEHLSNLEARNKGIVDLTGLEHATDLQVLGLGRNKIHDLSPLSGLTGLGYLVLDVNQISDISPLAGLVNLDVLRLGSNQITDVSPLAGLVNLRVLSLSFNQIVDLSPLAGLPNLENLEIRGNVDKKVLSTLPLSELRQFGYDETCDLAGVPISERVGNREYPSIFAPHGNIMNLPSLGFRERMAYHDVHWSSLLFHLKWLPSPEGVKTFLHVESAKEDRDDMLSRNPNMLFIVPLKYSSAEHWQYPEDWPYWLRDESGNRVVAGTDSDGAAIFIDHTLPEVQDIVVRQAVGFAKCGLFDGIFIDTWREDELHDLWKVHYYAHDYLEASLALLRRIREAVDEVRDDFLIIVNSNDAKVPLSAPYVNGTFMEIIQPYYSTNFAKIESTLLWSEQNFREPQINCLQGRADNREPVDSPRNQQRMRLFTTLSLTHSDGYVRFWSGIPFATHTHLYEIPNEQYEGHSELHARGEPHPHTEHYWYPFYDAPLGRPVGGDETKGQLYVNHDGETIDGLFIREFTNGWVVYNRSGKEQQIEFPEAVSGVASGVGEKRSHTLPDLDGEIYLKSESELETAPTADVNGDGVVNIQDLVIVANALGKAEPDLNGDGVVNIQDLVIVANAF